MNVILLWRIVAMWNALNKLRKEHFMNLGWKTITGAVLMGIGYAAKAMSVVDPIFDTIGDAIIAVGVALGGFGIRQAIAKTEQK